MLRSNLFYQYALEKKVFEQAKHVHVEDGVQDGVPKSDDSWYNFNRYYLKKTQTYNPDHDVDIPQIPNVKKELHKDKRQVELERIPNQFKSAYKHQYPNRYEDSKKFERTEYRMKTSMCPADFQFDLQGILHAEKSKRKAKRRAARDKHETKKRLKKEAWKTRKAAELKASRKLKPSQ